MSKTALLQGLKSRNQDVEGPQVGIKFFEAQLKKY